MARDDWERKIISKKRRTTISQLIHQNIEAIISGSYKLENLWSDTNNLLGNAEGLLSPNALAKFLNVHFLDANLLNIAKAIQTNQKTEKRSGGEESPNKTPKEETQQTNGEIKLETEKLVFMWLAQGQSRRDVTALLREKIQNNELPSEKEIITAFKEKNFSELTKTLYAYWDANKHKLS